MNWTVNILAFYLIIIESSIFSGIHEAQETDAFRTQENIL